jgi:c-di-GMP-binding flagellar brake protein YcgR
MPVLLFNKADSNVKERRKFTRLDVHHLLKYKALQDEEKLSFTKNISAGGVCFIAKEVISPGSITELLISFPGFPHPVKATAKVVWNKELKKLGGFETGAEFINVEEDAKHFIDKKILEVIKELEG